MRVLFVHQNFPGQFLHLAPALAARGHRVLALTDAVNQRESPVQTLRYPTPDPVTLEGSARTYAAAVARGERAARAALVLRDRDGFRPDVILAHSGWGESLFLKEVWPEARLIVYAELLYRTRGLDTDFDLEFQKESLEMRMRVVARSAHLSQALTLADAGLAPTDWQASSFPPEMRGKLRVIHDGIDTAAVRPDDTARLALPGTDVTLRPGDEVLTFVARNLEPYRGYHILMRALPEVLRRRPGARVVIVGGEDVSYGMRAPGGASWRRVFLDEVRDRLDPGRVHFLGRVPYADFLNVIRVSRAHAYLTYPFVLSWSMLEAMSAGALVVGSRTPPVTEVIRDGENGRLVDFFDVKGWEDTLSDALARPEAQVALRTAARQTVVDRYDLTSKCLPELIAFVEGG